MARHRPFPGLAELFNTKAKDKLQSYQLIDALIMDLHRSINDGAHSALAVDLTRSTFNFQDIHLLKGPSWINSEQFLLTYTHCLTSQTTIDFSAEPFGFQNLPGALAGPWLLEALAGPNTACLRPQAVENFNPEDRRFILLWYNNHSQRSDVCLYILDLRLNTIFAWPTYGFWIYQDLLHIFQLILDMPLWIAPQARATHFRKLPTASQWNHLAAPCPIHFGHYLQNNLGHLSRLEDLGILNSISQIYRTHTFDYFLPEEEQLFMSESTRSKLIVVPNDQIGRAHV